MIHVVEYEKFEELEKKYAKLQDDINDLRELMDEEVKGSKAAARKAGISVRTLEIERDRPGTLIIYKKEGRSVSYSLASLIAYRKSKRIPNLKIA